MKVMIATPTTGMVYAVYAASLAAMIVHYLNEPIFSDTEPESRDLALIMMIGSSIPDNRDKLAQETLRQKCSHLLFIDDDMGFAPECLNIALGRQQPVVLGNYRMKVQPYPFLCRTPDNSSEIITSNESTGIEPTYFGGFGFALIEAQVLAALPQPRFLPYWSEEKKMYTTEDKPFFEACRDHGFQPCVDHEVSKRLYHNGNFEYRYNLGS